MGPRPSITEVGSIRSMGDMQVVQREVSLSSDEARIERMDTPDLIGLETASSLVSPTESSDRSVIGLQHPTVVLRPTNPGPTPSGSPIATLHSRPATPDVDIWAGLTDSLQPLTLELPRGISLVGGCPMPGRSARHTQNLSVDLEEAGDLSVLTAPDAAASSPASSGSSGYSQRSVPAPTLPWGAQASPRSSTQTPPGSPLTRGAALSGPTSPPPHWSPLSSAENVAGGFSPVPSTSSSTQLGPTATPSFASSSTSSFQSTAAPASTTSAASVAATPPSTSGRSAGLAAAWTPRAIASPAASPAAAGPSTLSLRTHLATSRYNTPLLTPTAPSGSPGGRRPVHEIVASINRRGGSMPSFNNASPNRSVSGSPVSVPSPSRTYSIVRRDPLTIANPDIPEGENDVD
jgi:hypothetical protein